MKTIESLMLEVMEEFSISVVDELACQDFFLRKLHPSGVFCPGCGGVITSERQLKTFWAMKRVNCRDCGKTFSAVTGTALNGIGIDFRILYLLLFLVGHGAKPLKIAKPLGMSQAAAYLWARKAKGEDSVSEDPTDQGRFNLEP